MTPVHASAAGSRVSLQPTPLAPLLIAAGALVGSLFCRCGVASSPEATSCRVEVSLAVRGSLFAEASPDRPPISRPIELDARFRFIEAEPAAPGPTSPVSRRYQTATADFTVDGDRRRTLLAADAADLLIALRGTTPSPYLAQSFLSRAEAELLDLPFDAVLVDGLRPQAAVAMHETWRVAADITAGLLAIDTVESGGVDARLVAVQDGTAEVALEGTVSGAVAGAATRIELTGTYRCPAVAAAGSDRWLVEGRITGLTVELAERRAAGWVAPGLDVTATLTLERSANRSDSGETAEEPNGLGPAVTDRPSGPGRPGTVWERHRQGRYSLVLDDRWRVVEDGAEGLVMRLMDRGALVAQCSILPLPRTAPDKPPELETVRRDVERSLGEQFGRIASAEETTRGDGTRLIRVVAEGTAEDRPFRWIHHVLTDPAGYRAAVTCMHEPAMADRFGIADRELVSGLVLVADGPAVGPREARNPPDSAGPAVE